MFGRRRPLLRGAVVGGAAYYAGKKGAQAKARREQTATDQAVAGNKGGETNANLDELTKLQRLHENGVLTDQEFANAKQKVIAKM